MRGQAKTGVIAALAVVLCIALLAFTGVFGDRSGDADSGGAVRVVPAADDEAGVGMAVAAPDRAVPESEKAERLFGAALDPNAAKDSLIDDPDATAKHARLASEPRDAAWAPSAEETLRDRLDGVGTPSGRPITVRCASTICEVRMTTPQFLGDDFAFGKRVVDQFTARFEQARGTLPGFRSDATMHVLFSEAVPGELGVLAFFERN
jgi:hypothetical protein